MSDFRDALRKVGERLEPDPSIPSGVRSRVWRRQAMTAFVALIALTAVGVGSAAGIKALSDRAARVPAVKETIPSAPASPVACVSGWHITPNPTESGDYQDDLVAASAFSSNDIWAVGTRYITSDRSQTQALFEHWDGREWTVVDGADEDGRNGKLSAVAAVASNDVWAVGEFFLQPDGSFGAAPLVEHWDGTAWSMVESPPIGVGEGPDSGRSLDAIIAISANDVWILGHHDVNNGVSATLVADVFEHWDGHSWTIVPSPQSTFSGGPGAMNGVDAVSSTDIWAAGGAMHGFGEIPPGPAGWGGARVEHWDGHHWSVASSLPNSAPFSLVAALSETDVWAVRGGSFNPYGFMDRGVDFPFPPVEIMHWDGRSWSVSLRVSGPNDRTALPLSMLAAGPEDVWAVGTRHARPLLLHWDGRAWATPKGSDPGGPAHYHWLASVSRAADGTIVAFGGAEFPAEEGWPYPTDSLVNRLWFRCGDGTP
jgi:hypothetical protein